MAGEGRLRCYMSMLALDSMADRSSEKYKSFEDQLAMLAEAGFDGVQFVETATAKQLAACRAMGMGFAGSGRINLPSEAGPVADQLAEGGCECATLHVGWGVEDEREADALIESILRASADSKIPLYVETHRATIFQDMWRTVQFIKRFPELRFNGDFSHWYAGQEMVYGGFEKKFAFIQPVMERVRFLHGRVADPGCIQVRVDPEGAARPPYVEHFRQMWTACFRAFLHSGEGDAICFTTELLGPDIYYARTFGGAEESDRWRQSLLLKRMAAECFVCASSC